MTSLRGAPSEPEPSRRADLDDVRRRVTAALSDAWPPSGTGHLVLWRLRLEAGRAVVLEVHHDGEALSPAAESMLARDVSSRLEITVAVRDVTLDSEVIEAGALGDATFIARLARMASTLSDVPHARLCVERPPAPHAVDAGVAAAPVASLREIVEAIVGGVDPQRVEVTDGRAWRARLTLRGCAIRDAASDAGLTATDAIAPPDRGSPNR